MEVITLSHKPIIIVNETELRVRKGMKHLDYSPVYLWPIETIKGKLDTSVFLVVDGGQGYNPEYYILHISMWNDKFVYRIAVLSPNRLMAHWRYGHNPVDYGTPYSIQLIRLLSETQEKVINKTFVNCYPFGLRQGYFRRTRSITAWFLMSPGHQRLWYWLCMPGRHLAATPQ